jgi:hypothetical protein
MAGWRWKEFASVTKTTTRFSCFSFQRSVKATIADAAVCFSAFFNIRFPAPGLLLSCRLAALLLLCSSSAFAQEVSLATSRGPYYVGEPVAVQIRVENLADTQSADCRVEGESSDAYSVQGPTTGTSSQQSMQIINGRVTQSSSVSYNFTFQITAHRPGEFEIGPFVVSIDGQEQVVQGPSFDFEELESDPDMAVEIIIDDEKTFVGEQVPIEISWIFTGSTDELQYVYQNLRLRSPLFSRVEFLDKAPQSRTTLTFESPDGSVEVDAEVRRETRQGKNAVVVTARRIMLADAPGSFEDLLVTCRTKRVTEWGRDFFGDIRPRSTRPALAASEPFSLTIHPLPINNRPESFSGAVGNGFSIEVTANRSVVRVGDPIKLDVTLRGNGNLQSLSLPSLAGSTGFDESLFQLPAELPAGEYTGGEKKFELSLRVMDESVNQVPAIAFSWFNPDAEKYETAYSTPIALQVKEAQLVSASDVVSASPPAAESSSRSSPSAVDSSAPRMSDFLGANLAIERNTTRLVASRNLIDAGWAVPALYGAAVLSLLLAVAVRHRRQIDPEIAARRALYKSARSQIDAAERLPARQAAEQIAEALRKLVAGRSGPPRVQAENVIAACETLMFSPREAERAEVEQLVIRARSAVNALLRDATQ